MKKRKRIIINSYMKRIGIGVLISLIIVVVICLIKSEYRNIKTFSNGLFYIGGAELSAGFLSLFGNMKFRGDASYQVARTAGAESSQRRIREDLDGTQKSLNFVVYMGIVGAIMMVLSAALQYIPL
jgi:hypothetical protein